jgi:hypothetical protein
MTGEKLASDQRPEIVDPNNVPVVFTDWMITGGSFEGVVNLSLGTIDHSLKRPEDAFARVIVSVRLRCSKAFALNLYNALGQILGLERKPGDDPPDEPNPKKPPQNVIH